MPKKGIARYFSLFRNVSNPLEYILRKGERKRRDLVFFTRQHNIKFPVSEPLYQVFKEIFMEDVYDIDVLVSNLPSNPVIIDIGANAGFFDVILLSKIEKARILAYEPLQSNAQYFQNIMDINPVLNQSISLFPMGVTGTEKAELSLFMQASSGNQVVASVFDGFNKDNTTASIFPCISLTKIIESNNLHRVDLLKMDCEGSEYDIFYNTSADVIRKIQRMVIEVHDVDNEKNNFKNLNAYLESLGYSIRSAPINNFCFAVEAVRVD